MFRNREGESNVMMCWKEIERERERKQKWSFLNFIINNN